jgi:uncharacterized protein involved in cysteine biosynthesis
MTGDLTRGLVIARRAAALAWASPEVRRAYLQLALVLVAVTAVLDVAGVWGLVDMTRPELDARWWWIAVLWLLRLGGIAIVLLVAPIVATFVVGLLFGFLGDRVFLAGMRAVAPERAAVLAAAPGRPFGRMVADTMVRLGTFIAIGLGCFVLSFVPVVGTVLGPVLQGWRSSIALSWELLDPYFDKLGLDRPAQRAMLRRHQPALIGFSLPFVFVMAIPIVGALAFGVAQAAIAVLVVELIEADPT